MVQIERGGSTNTRRSGRKHRRQESDLCAEDVRLPTPTYRDEKAWVPGSGFRLVEDDGEEADIGVGGGSVILRGGHPWVGQRKPQSRRCQYQFEPRKSREGPEGGRTHRAADAQDAHEAVRRPQEQEWHLDAHAHHDGDGDGLEPAPHWHHWHVPSNARAHQGPGTTRLDAPTKPAADHILAARATAVLPSQSQSQYSHTHWNYCHVVLNGGT
ncbi:hypothetical protein FIBSPDRAFT_219535 [Athelia psychrophila]|uniref:Uncharacterized protein n=1 Tax=Athelia psychrophila TaxID=1759441 RepID=A0A165Z8M9_9AGAM|nr:hypothetical protein FIBSPDRAFT_219535 [Fibularhizoctonia sp. CBS 109695]